MSVTSAKSGFGRRLNGFGLAGGWFASRAEIKLCPRDPTYPISIDRDWPIMAALEEVVSDDGMYVAAPVALETFLSRYIASLLEPPAPEPAAQVEPPPPVVTKTAIPEVPKPVGAQSATPVTPGSARPAASQTDARVDAVVSPSGNQHTQSPLASPRELTDLLGPDPLLPPIESGAAAAAKPLFNPDAPFTATPVAPPREARKMPPYARIAALVALVLVLGGGGFAGYKYLGASAVSPAMGSLNVQSNPAGVDVFVDGVAHGRTPARVSLSPGSHILELRGRGVPRVIPFTVTANAEVSQYLELPEAPVTGQLAVQSDPPGAKVIVDGTERGVAPLTIPDLAPGDHKVELQSDAGGAKHTVTVQAGGTASLVVPIGTAASGGPVSGWVAVKAPFTMEIREQGRLLGTTDADRLMITAGRHELDLVNDTLGYRASRVVVVGPGKVASISLDLPMGVINLNAAPWAEVYIDGRRVGETPIGNLSVSIGPHVARIRISDRRRSVLARHLPESRGADASRCRGRPIRETHRDGDGSRPHRCRPSVGDRRDGGNR